MIVESGYIHPLGRGGMRRMGLPEDRLIPGLKGLVDAVHAEGAKDELAPVLQALSFEFQKIGDCANPRKAIDAIHEGFQAGLKM